MLVVVATGGVGLAGAGLVVDWTGSAFVSDSETAETLGDSVDCIGSGVVENSGTTVGVGWGVATVVGWGVVLGGGWTGVGTGCAVLVRLGSPFDGESCDCCCWIITGCCCWTSWDGGWAANTTGWFCCRDGEAAGDGIWFGLSCLFITTVPPLGTCNLDGSI